LLIVTWKIFADLNSYASISVVELGAGKFCCAPRGRLRISFFCWAASVPVGPNFRSPAGYNRMTKWKRNRELNNLWKMNEEIAPEKTQFDHRYRYPRCTYHDDSRPCGVSWLADSPELGYLRMSHVWERRSKADLVALRLITRIRRRKLAMRADCWNDVGRERRVLPR